MKKILSTLLVVLVLFNFIFCNSFESYADVPKINSDSGANNMSTEDQKDYEEDGGGTSMGAIGTILSTITGILADILDLFPMMIQSVMKATTNVDEFTIEKTVFNEIELFNVDYFNFKTDNSALKILRPSIAKWYYLNRLIAMAVNLLILIYVGIRMALSTISSDKAKYKKMLIAWVESMILLFVMHYILIFIMKLGNLFTDTFKNIKDSLISGGDTNFEETCMDTIYGPMLEASGWSFTLYSVVFWFLVSIQLKFYFTYFKRLITVGFLIIVSPLVTVTYPIDKIGDGKAQAFTVMMTEFTMNVFIQPIHALIYMIFMLMAGEIAKYSILIAMIFLFFLTKVEKIILQMFELRNVVSLRPVDENGPQK